MNGIYFYELKFNSEIPGDYNHDQKIDLVDFDIWKTNYLNKQMSLVDFSLWKTAYLQTK